MEGIDLAGMERQRVRDNTIVTILTKTDGVAWTRDETSKIVEATSNSVSGHPKHPLKLIIPGEPSKHILIRALGHERFERRVTRGMNSSVLPFKPSFI